MRVSELVAKAAQSLNSWAEARGRITLNKWGEVPGYDEIAVKVMRDHHLSARDYYTVHYALGNRIRRLEVSNRNRTTIFRKLLLRELDLTPVAV